jgi:transcription initiation factor TFIID subunit 1
MDNDNEVLGQLGGFALGEVFKDLGIDTGDGINTVRGQLGLGKSSNALSRDAIYGGKFVDAGEDDDDDDDDDDEDKDDLEAQVDREMYDEKWQSTATSSRTTQLATGGGQPQKLMRGEVDDFDDDDDEEEEDQGNGPNESRSANIDTAGQQIPSQLGASSTMTIKQEPTDDNYYGNNVTFDQSTLDEANADRMSVDPVPAPQPRRPVDVKELFPSFDYGKTLDFTELFSTSYRPRKRQKTATDGSKGEHERRASWRLADRIAPQSQSHCLKRFLEASQREMRWWHRSNRVLAAQPSAICSFKLRIESEKSGRTKEAATKN